MKIQTANGKTVVESPYHPLFVSGARALNGKYSEGTWSFDARDESRVRELCREVYGTDGADAADLVTLRVSLGSGGYSDSLFVAGRQVASRRGRDNAVKLGDGVILVSGGFPSWGGSMKYPALEPKEGTVLLVRDVPRPAAEKAVAASPAKFNPNSHDVRDIKVELEPETVTVGSDAALRLERDRLLARIAEIDALLKSKEVA